MAASILRHIRGLLVTAVIGLCPALICAQGGPPMITDDTETVPTGHWEINTAFTIERGFDARVFGTPLLDVNYGISKHLQLKVEVPWIVIHQNGEHGINGLGNTNVGVRWRFRDEDEHHRVAVSMYPQFEFNNPGPSLRRGIVDKGPEFLMPIQWQTDLGNGFALGGDVGYRFKRGEDEIFYGVILGREFKRFELMGEIHSTGGRQHLSESEVVYNLGSRVPLTKHTTLITSAGKTIRRGHDPRFICYAGIQVNF